jgi:GNAT superfamily N-acetyltransferase
VEALAAEQVPVAATRPLRREVLRPHETLAEMAAHEPPAAIAVGAFRDGALVAVGLVGPEGEPGDWRVRGMATAAPARGRGAGSAVLAALIRIAEEQGARRVWAEVRVPARTLYERAGFRAVSGVFERPMIGPHVRMERP